MILTYFSVELINNLRITPDRKVDMITNQPIVAKIHIASKIFPELPHSVKLRQVSIWLHQYTILIMLYRPFEVWLLRSVNQLRLRVLQYPDVLPQSTQETLGAQDRVIPVRLRHRLRIIRLNTNRPYHIGIMNIPTPSSETSPDSLELYFTSKYSIFTAQ